MFLLNNLRIRMCHFVILFSYYSNYYEIKMSQLSIFVCFSISFFFFIVCTWRYDGSFNLDSFEIRFQTKGLMLCFIWLEFYLFFINFLCAPFGYLYNQIFFSVIASNIAYIHPVNGAGVRTHDLLIMSHLP